MGRISTFGSSPAPPGSQKEERKAKKVKLRKKYRTASRTSSENPAPETERNFQENEVPEAESVPQGDWAPKPDHSNFQKQIDPVATNSNLNQKVERLDNIFQEKYKEIQEWKKWTEGELKDQSTRNNEFHKSFNNQAYTSNEQWGFIRGHSFELNMLGQRMNLVENSTKILDQHIIETNNSIDGLEEFKAETLTLKDDILGEFKATTSGLKDNIIREVKNQIAAQVASYFRQFQSANMLSFSGVPTAQAEDASKLAVQDTQRILRSQNPEELMHKALLEKELKIRELYKAVRQNQQAPLMQSNQYGYAQNQPAQYGHISNQPIQTRNTHAQSGQPEAVSYQQGLN